jgi:hypothetical protein
MRERIAERALLIVVPAVTLALADLIVKATLTTPPWSFHARSHAWVVLCVFLLVGALLLAFVPSRAVALAAGVLSGGVLGNLVSARLEGNRVPNPFVIGDYTGGIAFNLADVFVVTGNLLLAVALMTVTLQNRSRLIPPRAWERALRERLRS